MNHLTDLVQKLLEGVTESTATLAKHNNTALAKNDNTELVNDNTKDDEIDELKSHVEKLSSELETLKEKNQELEHKMKEIEDAQVRIQNELSWRLQILYMCHEGAVAAQFYDIVIEVWCGTFFRQSIPRQRICFKCPLFQDDSIGDTMKVDTFTQGATLAFLYLLALKCEGTKKIQTIKTVCSTFFFKKYSTPAYLFRTVWRGNICSKNLFVINFFEVRKSRD